MSRARILGTTETTTDGLTDRDSPAQSLGGGENVRFDTQILVSPEGSGSSHASLDLIDDEKGTGLVAELSCLLEKGRVAGNDPALSLEGFQHDGRQSLSVGGRALHGLLEAGDVVVGTGLESLDHFPVVAESLMVLGLLRGRQRREGPAVEGLVGRNNDGLGDPAVRCVSTGQLDGGLVGLGARVAEEGLVGAGVGAEPLGEGRLFGNVVEVADVMNPLHLLLDGGGELLVVVSEGAGCDPADAIQIGLSIGRLQKDALAGIDGQFVSPAKKNPIRRCCVRLHLIACVVAWPTVVAETEQEIRREKNETRKESEFGSVIDVSIRIPTLKEETDSSAVTVRTRKFAERFRCRNPRKSHPIPK